MKNIFQRIIILSTLLFAFSTDAQDLGLQSKSFFNGKLIMEVPIDFQPMSEEMLKVKYPNDKRPTIVLTNPRGSVNIALNHTTNSVLPEQLPSLHQAMEKSFKNLYPSATWFRSEMIKINNRDWFVLELRTPAIDTQVRNIMAGTSVDKKLLLVSFNTTLALEPEWLAKGNRMIQSIQIKE